jgi:hypothetical protein
VTQDISDLDYCETAGKLALHRPRTNRTLISGNLGLLASWNMAGFADQQTIKNGQWRFGA